MKKVGRRSAVRSRSAHHSGEPQASSPSASTTKKNSRDMPSLERKQKEEKLTEVQLTRNFLQKEIEARRSRRGFIRRTSGISEGADLEDSRSKLFVVSLKLPFTVFYDEDAGFSYERDAFEMNIADILERMPKGRLGAVVPEPANAVLVGSPVVRRQSDRSVLGVLSAEVQEALDAYLRSELKVVPVFLPPNRDRFSDWMIFPLFNYSLPSAETGLGYYDWEGYELINSKFRDAVLMEYSRGDLVWINDYPLMLLPKLLRQEQPDIPLGFYLHCVFPSSEVYRILPQREDILRGVLSSNIVGFHNFEYAQNFLNSCIHVLGLECTASGIEACIDAGGTYTKVVTVPLGIDLEPYQRVLKAQETRDRIVSIQEAFAGFKLVVAVDRLEEKKGIPHKIMAFHKLLQKEPSIANRSVFVQIVDTADEACEESEGERAHLLQQIYQMVGEVNSKFGTIGHLPIHFLCHSFNRAELAALFVNAHVMIDTPLRDVFSQSAHEFLCCQEGKGKNCGVLILSEFSGSIQSLRAAALSVNPWDTSAFADAILEALQMEYQDRTDLNRYGSRYVQEYTLSHWAMNFLEEIRTTESECETERLQIPPPLDHDRPVAAMRKAKRRVIILGFSGTLVAPARTPFRPQKLPTTLLGNLQVIAEDPHTHLVVISGLSRDILDQTFGGVPCWIIAESGVCYREPADGAWHSSIEQRDTEWLGPVKEIMEYFAARTPGSNIVEMSSSVSWLYQKTQGDHAAIQSKDLLIHLWAGPLLSAPAEVVVEKDSVTVRPTGTGKVVQLEKVLQQICLEDDDEASAWKDGNTFVVCIGDFMMRDEDIFAAVQRFFEPEAGEGVNDSSAAADTDYDWTKEALMDRDGHRSEALKNLEANSMSLGSGFDLAATRLSLSQLKVDDGHFRPDHRLDRLERLERVSESALDSEAKKVEKSPSEPDWQADHNGGNYDASGVNAEVPMSGSAPSIFTCTVSRKATRAAYHLSDTNDVCFLIAKLARELRRAEAAADHGDTAVASSGAGGSGGGTSSGLCGLDALFEPL
eukprot:TRINITY_DN23030_c0_g2_i1.p1 TRINITY_DN23030_c0_g2~~TRINITY_DN23030_c0_g2_i1.p1  ORF type:complete len:1038 (+),score=250.03 TRINITY_DN23030_c0_g2_i1:431-3544(+)